MLAPVPVKITTLLLPAILKAISLLAYRKMLLLPLARVSKSIVANERLPAPSVTIDCPEVPPLILTLPILLRLLTPVVVMLVVVIAPLAKIILAGVSPTENPATELKGLIAIVVVSSFNEVYLCFYLSFSLGYHSS